MARHDKQSTEEQEQIKLSVPWAERENILRSQYANSAPGLARYARDFIKSRSEVHQAFIVETERTKRFGYGLAAALLALACIVPIFAPAGRETTSWIISAALFVFSAGAMGYTTVWLKMKKRQMKLSKDNP